MSTELCEEDVVVQLSSSPQIISTDTALVPVSVGGDGAGAGGSGGAGGSRGAAGAGGGVELGRKLLLAARAGDTNAVLELMAKGAPFTTDWLGTSPLHLAAANNHVETMAVLLRAGVSRDSRTKVERTPLHLAATAGHARAAALLLEHGAAVDARDMLRMTPLHWAAARGHADAARCLLRHGADARLRCKFRKTPRCLALRAGRADLAQLIDDEQSCAPVARPIERPKPQQHKRVEIKPQTKVKIQAEKKIVIESKTQPIPPSANVGRGATVGGAATAAGAAGAEGAVGAGTAGAGAGTAGASAAGAAGAGAAGAGAAALLRAHGITLLPADRGSTVLTALRSGRTVVLSDAGKLMLKESGASTNDAHIITNNTNANTLPNANIIQVNTNLSASASADGNFSVAGVDSANLGQSVRGARLKPAKYGKGVKVVTLNKNQQVKRVIHPNDFQQVKVVRVPAAGGAGGAGGAGARLRPALKIVLDKAHLQRLLAPARALTQSSAPEYAANEVVQNVDESSTIDITMDDDSQEGAGAGAGAGEGAAEGEGSLRAQLSAARAAIASLGAELRACRARLAHYEGVQMQ